MKYRAATKSDSLELVRLMSELGYSHTQESITTNLQNIESSGGSVFLAVYEGSVVGCICAIIDVRLAAGKCGEIVSLIISADYRGKGIGKGLINHAEEWLRTRVGSIRVRANIIRNEAHEFYQNLGYNEEKTQKIFRKNV